jgi:dihydrofolate reductase
MGRKTFESIGRPLPNRKNIVLSKNGDKELVKEKEIEIYQNLEDLIRDYKNSQEEIFIIGGEQIYKEFLQKEQISRLYISYIDFSDCEADAYFPEIDYKNWEIAEEKKYDNWKFCMYEKK